MIDVVPLPVHRSHRLADDLVQLLGVKQDEVDGGNSRNPVEGHPRREIADLRSNLRARDDSGIGAERHEESTHPQGLLDCGIAVFIDPARVLPRHRYALQTTVNIHLFRLPGPVALGVKLAMDAPRGVNPCIIPASREGPHATDVTLMDIHSKSFARSPPESGIFELSELT